MALRALQDKFDRRITITDLGGTLDAPVISLGVNWASIGAVPAEEAVAFAAELTEAAKAASEFKFNGYEIVY
jgi:hypothetical protein